MNCQLPIDTILIERGQRGDPEAIEALFKRYYPKAFTYALKMTKHTDDAADIVSEAFMRVSRAINRFRFNSSFSSWLYRIIKNCFLDAKKRRRVNVVVSLDAELETKEGIVFWQPIDPTESAYAMVVTEEYACRVRSIVCKLPQHYRQLLQMYYKEELSYNRISQTLMVPAGTVKSRLHRAKLSLRDMIRNDAKCAGVEQPDELRHTAP